MRKPRWQDSSHQHVAREGTRSVSTLLLLPETECPSSAVAASRNQQLAADCCQWHATVLVSTTARLQLLWKAGGITVPPAIALAIRQHRWHTPHPNRALRGWWRAMQCTPRRILPSLPNKASALLCPYDVQEATTFDCALCSDVMCMIVATVLGHRVRHATSR